MQLRSCGLIAALVFSLAACTTVVRERVDVHAPAQKVVVRHMPQPINEARGPAPGPGYGWVQGHWVWQNGDWMWRGGHWVAVQTQPMPPVIVEQITVMPSPAHFWVPGHWEWYNNQWNWRHGHWQS